MKKGFTLLEMLVVIGIIAVLTAATLGGFQHALKSGEKARAHELVANVATALTAYFERERVWPKEIRQRASSGDKLDEKVAWYLRNDLALDVSSDATADTTPSANRKTIGYDRFGVVTPWALAVMKRMNASLLEGKSATDVMVSNGATVDDHTIRFAVDLDGDGIIENVIVGGVGRGADSSVISVRATAIAWCCNKDGTIESYAKGVRGDGIYSWSYGQTQKVK